MNNGHNILAARVLNDGLNISYRQLSRELKVHANEAKQILSAFHSSQNEKKAGTISATYLINGSLKIEPPLPESTVQEPDGDVHMPSSPFMSSAPYVDHTDSPLPVRQLSLVPEQYLEAVRRRYADIDSLHLYSIGLASLRNLEVLSDCNRIITKQYIKEDPLLCAHTYGTIRNPGVRRRTGKRPLNILEALPEPQDAKVLANSQSKPVKQLETSEEGMKNVKLPATLDKRSSTEEKVQGDRRTASSIFKAFAAKSKPKFQSQESGGSSTSTMGPQKPRAEEDAPMDDVSEDENPEAFVTSSKNPNPKEHRSRAERQHALEKLMEDDDDDGPDETMVDAPPSELHAARDPKPDSESESEFIDKAPPQSESPEPQLKTSSGRRRGRRKIMKKKTIKDDEGYLVTKEEPAWESFSEDEPTQSHARKGTPISSATSTKGKKEAKKSGQGNITSFFGKR